MAAFGLMNVGMAFEAQSLQIAAAICKVFTLLVCSSCLDRCFVMYASRSHYQAFTLTYLAQWMFTYVFVA